MELGLKERVALVMGGSSGLGKAVARELCRERARVLVVARSETRLRDSLEEIRRETAGQIFGVAGDVLEPETASRAVEEALSRWGRIDIAVANAGGPRGTLYESTSISQYEHSLQLSLMSTIRLAQAVTPHMKRQRWGRFIALTSVAAKQPLPGVILSNTTRPAVVGFVKSMAMELAPFNILCNVIAPGFMKTGRVEDVVAERADREGTEPAEIMREIHNRIPLGRMGRAEELADLVAFLASDRASYITGTTIQVDGGFVQGLF